MYNNMLPLCGLESQPEELAHVPPQLWKMGLETKDTLQGTAACARAPAPQKQVFQHPTPIQVAA